MHLTTSLMCRYKREVVKDALDDSGLIRACGRVTTELFGSLGATGAGHGSPKAIILGLEIEEQLRSMKLLKVGREMIFWLATLSPTLSQQAEETTLSSLEVVMII